MRSWGVASRARVTIAVVAPVLVGLVLALLLVLDQRARARQATDLGLRATVASTVSQVRTELRDELASAASQTSVESVPANPGDHAPISRDAAITARDSGTPTLDDTARPASIIVPVYRAGAPVTTTTQRRAALTGFRVVPLRLQPVVEQLAPSSGGLVVRGPTRRVAADPAPAPAGTRTYAVDMDLTGFPGWVVQSWAADPGTPGTAWLSALGLLVLFVVIGLALAGLINREAAATARRRTLERDRSLVTGLAPVLQASLDVGEVVPAVSSHLVQGLTLAGLSLSTPGATGERQLFAWGQLPDPTVRPMGSAPHQLPAGSTLAIALTRGGRTLGILRIVAGATLGHDALLALATASELLGSSLANAEAFASQQELLERMRSVDELKTVFLATASHELRTPVTAIVGFSTLLLEHWDTMGADQKRVLVERTMTNGRRLNALIEQLLDFSQLERGLPRPSDELLDLGDVVSRILAEQPELQAGHELVVAATPGCLVRGSSAAVERIVTNLVGNAAKYSPPGTSITVTVQREADRAVLLVDDQGPGIHTEDRARVFSRFYRGRGDSVTRTRGAGIGLAIVAEYAASMAGTAGVDDAPDGGARLRISFPSAGVLPDPNAEGSIDVASS
jgi:signal transduction histidine kinase